MLRQSRSPEIYRVLRNAERDVSRTSTVLLRQRTRRQDITARKTALVGNNRYLQKPYGQAAQSGQTSPQTGPRVVPAGAIAGRDANGNIVGYKTADGKVVKFHEGGKERQET